MAQKRCRHKRLIGRKVEWVATEVGTPQRCDGCGKLFVPDIPRQLLAPSRSSAYLCPECIKNLRCHRCRRPFDLKEGSVAECFSCGTVLFLCPRCAKKSLYVNLSDNPTPEELVGKLYRIIEELMNLGRKKSGGWNLWNLFKKKKSPPSNGNFPLIMNINMYFQEDSLDYYEEGFDADEDQ